MYEAPPPPPSPSPPSPTPPPAPPPLPSGQQSCKCMHHSLRSFKECLCIRQQTDNIYNHGHSGTWSCNPCIKNPVDGKYYGNENEFTSDGVMGHCWMDHDCVTGGPNGASYWQPHTTSKDFKGLDTTPGKPLQFDPKPAKGKMHGMMIFLKLHIHTYILLWT